MTKYTVILVVCFLACFSIYPEVSIFSELKKEVDLTVKNVVYGEKALEIEFEIKNVSENDIWVCASDFFDEMSVKNEVPVLRTIEENGGWIKIEFVSLKFDNVIEMSTEPRSIWTKYQKLKSGEVLKRKVVLSSPITEENDDKYSYLKPSKNKILSEKVQDIHLIVGYHSEDLNKIENCCDRRSQKSMDICELTLKCAKNNPEKIMSKRFHRKQKKIKE